MIFQKKALIIGAMAAFWGTIAIGAVTAASTGGLNFSFNFSTSLPTKSGPAKADASRTDGVIAVERIELAAGPAQGYRQFTALRTNVIAPGTAFNIYLEPINMTTTFEPGAAGQQGAIKASMTVDIEVRNAAGAVVGSQKGAWKLPLSIASAQAAPPTRVYADLSINHLNFAAGRYQLVITVNDDLSRRSVERIVDVVLREAAAATPAQPAAPARR